MKSLKNYSLNELQHFACLAARGYMASPSGKDIWDICIQDTPPLFLKMDKANYEYFEEMVSFLYRGEKLKLYLDAVITELDTIKHYKGYRHFDNKSLSLKLLKLEEKARIMRHKLKVDVEC